MRVSKSLLLKIPKNLNNSISKWGKKRQNLRAEANTSRQKFNFRRNLRLTSSSICSIRSESLECGWFVRKWTQKQVFFEQSNEQHKIERLQTAVNKRIVGNNFEPPKKEIITQNRGKAMNLTNSATGLWSGGALLRTNVMVEWEANVFRGDSGEKTAEKVLRNKRLFYSISGLVHITELIKLPFADKRESPQFESAPSAGANSKSADHYKPHVVGKEKQCPACIHLLFQARISVWPMCTEEEDKRSD